ncbi:hypothetical protein C8F04DRAFT_1279060 [Mycena alexandri]|uniref:CxC2-like cysteine cluster KDZ transposase-associated domain-containing protein n=1 Tax=Mycena alexandri TaxID=1745969 RepID=A0AAD6RY29_9AGAR|nr:hypothetical protein C8F04DRAFT_1279060 [Mycena alexandri]
MSKRKRGESHYDLLPGSSDEEPGELPRFQTAAKPARGQILQESTSVADDGRMRHAARLLNIFASPTKLKRAATSTELRVDVDNPPVYDYDPYYDNEEREDDTTDNETDDDEVAREARASDDPLAQWEEHDCDAFLDEQLRYEGRGNHCYERCLECGEGAADHRCMDCLSGGELLCRDCIVARHVRSPLHIVQAWNGEWFEGKTLRELGLRIQLGHWYTREQRCPVPERARKDGFVIISEDGVHNVGLDFCGCGHSGSRAEQLLRAQLFPATADKPRTAATFSVMRRFHLLSFESKCSAYHFYQSLARATDNTGLKPPKNRYHQFRRMVREWRYVKMMKRAGRGNDPLGRAATAPGGCALLCPACPHPGENLPENWKDVPEDRKFLYGLFLALDANFRLKRKDVSSEEKDPGLGRGVAFYGEVKKYMAHLAKHWDKPQERSHCVSHDAVDKPDREACGTASSGIATVDCARHNMKRPNGVGDLQLGERYINVDYMFFSSIAGTELQRFYVSYDIACQWHINIWNRMKDYDAQIHYDPRGKFMPFLVPKFHLPAHIEACNLLFSFNLTPGVGQTEGESPERGWANTNPLAGSTKEMGPGARRDTVDDHFNDWNHKNIVALGRTMLAKTTRAVPQMVETVEALADLEKSLDEAVVMKWTDMAEKWEKSAANPNPFETMEKDDHLAKVRRDLAMEAAEREVSGLNDDWEVQEDMHVTELLVVGLQLEEQQRALKFDSDAIGLHLTDDQRRNLVERSSKLRRKLNVWIETQSKFFPVVTKMRDADDKARKRAARTRVVPGVRVENVSLLMPSAMWKRRGNRVDVCKADVLRHEYRLRVGQGNEALHEIRRQLLVRTHLYKHKDRQIRWVRANMRSSDRIEAVNDRIRRCAAQYRAARTALVTLGPALGEDAWEQSLRVLAKDDIRGRPRATFGDPERQVATRMSKKQRRKKKAKERPMSWIWVVQGKAAVAGEDPALNEALRIEWARARARAHRWTEEVDLLEEEMRRIQQFLTWRADMWEAQVGRCGTQVDEIQLEGDAAYARRQAAFQRGLCNAFAVKWAHLSAMISGGRTGIVPQVAAAEDEGSEGEEESDGSEDEYADEEPVPQMRRRAVKAAYTD